MKYSLFILLVIVSFAGNTYAQHFDTAKLYQPERLRSDFRFLRKTLQATHPNLYLYTNKTAMDAFFDSLEQQLTAPRTLFEFYNLLTLLNDKIKDGHTMMLPPEEVSAYFRASCKFLPFYFTIMGNRLFVGMNCSRDTLIQNGAEVTSINNTSASGIINSLVKRQVRDGYSEGYPRWILSSYFKEYYGFHFGHPESFSIDYRNPGASISKTVIGALFRDTINFVKNERYKAKSTKTAQGISLEFDTATHAAILTIRSLDSDLLNAAYHQQFLPVIDSLFKIISRYQPKRFILDMRDNQGGDFENGRHLLSLLVNEPLNYLPRSKEYKKIKPAPLQYKGKLIVLINGGTFSNAAIVCAYLQHSRHALIIGEESAGNRTILSGDPVEVVLPETKIIMEVSTTKYVIYNRPNDGHGIIPEYRIIPTVKDIIMDRDVVKDDALKLK